jgi:hypothetical protein
MRSLAKRLDADDKARLVMKDKHSEEPSGNRALTVTLPERSKSPHSHARLRRESLLADHAILLAGQLAKPHAYVIRRSETQLVSPARVPRFQP